MRSITKLAVTCATLLTASTVMADEAKPTADVFFDFDSARLGADTSARLADLVEFSRNHPDTKIVLDGNTDSTGSDVYNIGLSSRRTVSVQAKLIAMGMPADRIYRGINGEDGLRRSSDALDRRVTISTTELPLHELIHQVFVRGSAVLWNQPVTAAEIDGPPAIKTVAVARR